MIERDLGARVLQQAEWFPVVTITGPRQSGKTTLARHLFGGKPYVNLEPLDVRSAVRDDPRGFLADHPDGAVVDEVQHVPELLSYLQAEVDERPTAGRFILTGSQHLGLTEAVTQSLAGRTGISHLYPPSLSELRRFPDPPAGLWETLWAGAFPRIWDAGIPADEWMRGYVTTYVERDVRRVLDVGNLEAFRTFIELCAGRTASELNLSGIGDDAGVARNTVRSWLSVLEATFLTFTLRAWAPSLRKRLVKASKLHFVDTGLVCHLLRITDPEQLQRHPLRGAIFETWVASEIVKARANRGADAPLAHFRESRGLEVDIVIEDDQRVALVEAKSGATVGSDMVTSLRRLAEALGDRYEAVDRVLVYGGDTSGRRSGAEVLSWSGLHERRW